MTGLVNLKVFLGFESYAEAVVPTKNLPKITESREDKYPRCNQYELAPDVVFLRDMESPPQTFSVSTSRLDNSYSTYLMLYPSLRLSFIPYTLCLFTVT